MVDILATLAVDESVLNYAEKRGFLVLAVGDEIMEIKNRPGNAAGFSDVLAHLFDGAMTLLGAYQSAPENVDNERIHQE